MLEHLLYYHLSVMEIDDSKEVELFIKKIKLLATLSLEKYGSSHVKIYL
jgi:hypothetical protein